MAPILQIKVTVNSFLKRFCKGYKDYCVNATRETSVINHFNVVYTSWFTETWGPLQYFCVFLWFETGVGFILQCHHTDGWPWCLFFFPQWPCWLLFTIMIYNLHNTVKPVLRGQYFVHWRPFLVHSNLFCTITLSSPDTWHQRLSAMTGFIVNWSNRQPNINGCMLKNYSHVFFWATTPAGEWRCSEIRG